MAQKKFYRVMVVDDDQMIRQLLRVLLRGAEHQVVCEAGSGEQALVELRQNRIDIVFLDIMMPGESGLETLEKICSDYPKVRVIMISTEVTKENVTAAKTKGAVGFLAKPFTAANVINAIERLQPENNSKTS